MATADAINAFSQTLVHLLRAGLSPGLVNASRISIATPDDFSDYADPMTPAVTVFLYRVAVNPELRNRPWRQLTDGTRSRPMLPLDLCYLVTAWARNTDDEHRITAGWAEIQGNLVRPVGRHRAATARTT